MKAMIVSDFVLRSALQLLGICLVIALFMGYVMGAVGTAAAIAAMVPFTGLFSLAAYDEQNNWERFRLTLPLTRRQVVFGRYASIALLTAGSLALALVLGLGIAALAGLLPAEWLPESLSPSENTPEMIVGSTVGGVSVVAIAMAVAMPVITRFGMTKAARIVPIIVVLIVAFAVAFFGNGVQPTGVLADLVQWLDTYNNYLFLAAALVAVVALIYVASAFVAAKLYEEKREFWPQKPEAPSVRKSDCIASPSPRGVVEKCDRASLNSHDRACALTRQSPSRGRNLVKILLWSDFGLY